MLEMHWVIFVLALLACGAIGWMTRGRVEKGYRLAVERENERLQEEASAFYKAPRVIQKKRERVCLRTNFDISRNDVAMLGMEGALELARREAVEKIMKDASEFIELRKIDAPWRGGATISASLWVLKPEEEEL